MKFKVRKDRIGLELKRGIPGRIRYTRDPRLMQSVDETRWMYCAN